MFSPVLNKMQNYRLWQGGAFGNKLRAWRTITEWCLAGGHTDLREMRVALRVVSFGWGGPCRYDLAAHEVDGVARLWTNQGIAWDRIMVNEMAPHAEILQGEYLNDVCLDEEGFALPGYFFYSTENLRMRDALRADSAAHTYGLRANLMLREAMTPSSYEDWRVLLDQYPGHVLEVSVYDRCLGDVPGRNALVWEVRRY